MKRVVFSLLVAAMLPGLTALCRVVDTESPTLTVNVAVIDTVAARQAMSALSSERATRLSIYNSIHNAIDADPALAGKKELSMEELLTLDSLIAFPPTALLDSYSKILKDREKGRFHKSLAPMLGRFREYVSGRIMAWTDTFVAPQDCPPVRLSFRVPNRFYLPSIINNPAMMDSVDYDSQVGRYAWIDREPHQRVSRQYPRTFSYNQYNSHPDLRVIGDMIYNDDGALVAVKRVGRTSVQLRDTDSPLRLQMLDSLAAADYLNNRYDILSEEDPVNPILRARFGIDNNPELAAEPNKKVTSWLNRINSEHAAQLGAVYRITRLGDCMFALDMLTEQGLTMHRAIIEASNQAPFDTRWRVIAMERAPEARVDLDHRDNSVPAPPRRLYVIPEILPTLKGGDEALEQHLLKNLNIPAGSIPSGRNMRAVVAISVDERGKVTGSTFLRSAGSIDSEVARAISSLPDMEPGRVDLQPVASVRYLVFTFSRKGIHVK